MIYRRGTPPPGTRRLALEGDMAELLVPGRSTLLGFCYFGEVPSLCARGTLHKF